MIDFDKYTIAEEMIIHEPVPPERELSRNVLSACIELERVSKLPTIRLIPGNKYSLDDLQKMSTPRIIGTPDICAEYWVPQYEVDRLTETKIGGYPYWPKNMQYPTTKSGQQLVMVAQLNLDKLPKIPNMPTKGLLQFFTDSYDQQIGKVVYHSTVDKKNAKFDIQITTLQIIDYFPINGVYYPTPKLETMGITTGCEDFWPKLCEQLNKKLGTEYKNYRDIPKNIRDIVYNSKMGNSWGCRIGGYPNFTQSDIYYERMNKKLQLILQLDSEAGMMWGDSGIANFFTPLADLKKKKFENTVFNWDCY